MNKRASSTALLLIDFVDGGLARMNSHLATTALRAGQHAARLKACAKKAGMPVIFANDHHGNWKEDFAGLVAKCRRNGGASAKLIELLQPGSDDFHVLKPRHSAFYGTPLEFLLTELQITRLVLCGMEADMCILFTANDAYMRKFRIWTPRNCIAARSVSRLSAALAFMKTNLQADVRPFTNALRLDA